MTEGVLIHSPEALARELGWTIPLSAADQQVLDRLLDDEVEELDAPDQERLRAAVASHGGLLQQCPDCAMVSLTHFLAADGHCRVCGAALVPGAAGSRGSAASGPTLLDLESPGGFTPTQGSPSLGRPVQLAPDNEDWEARAERMERERIEAKHRAKAEAKAKAEAEARAKAEAEAKRKAAAEAKARAEAEAKAKAAAEARARAEAEARRKAEAEAKAKAAAEAKRKAAEEAERKRKAAEEAERKRKAAEEAARRAAEEAEQRLAAERQRPALGAMIGARAGQVIRIPDVPAGGLPEVQAGEDSQVFLAEDGNVVLCTALGTLEKINGKPVTGTFPVPLNAILTLASTNEVFLVGESAELESATAPDVHFVRADGKPGGPWPYWHEDVLVGAGPEATMKVIDDFVDDVHAKITTCFGRVILEDLSGKEDGVFVKDRRMRWLMLKKNMEFRLGLEGGPLLKVMPGVADLKPQKKAARAMRPTRNNRTLLEVADFEGNIRRRVFLFTRREIRIGNSSRNPKTGKIVNELPLMTAPTESTTLSTEQAGLNLTREGIDLQRWRMGEAPMFMDDEPLEPGDTVSLKRRFELRFGDDMNLEGRLYRSPSDVEIGDGPPRLGMNGGHPCDCLRLERKHTNHIYLWLIRRLKIGSSPNDTVYLKDMDDVDPNHVQILLKAGKYQILTPKSDATLELPNGDVVALEPGVPATLPIDAKLLIGEAIITFRVVTEEDFAF